MGNVFCEKLVVDGGNVPSDEAQYAAKALVDLAKERSSTELDSLYITGAKAIEINSDRKAVVVYFPVPLLKTFRQVGTSIRSSLQKKLSEKLGAKTVDVLLVSKRRILPTEQRKGATRFQKRPNSRSLTAVHREWLDDIVHPAVVTGRRTLFRPPHGKQVTTVSLPHGTDINLKETWAKVYKSLTGQIVNFTFDAAVVEPDQQADGRRERERLARAQRRQQSKGGPGGRAGGRAPFKKTAGGPRT